MIGTSPTSASSGELFMNTPWYCDQPLREPIDFNLNDTEIMAQAERIAKRLPKFMSGLSGSKKSRAA